MTAKHTPDAFNDNDLDEVSGGLSEPFIGAGAGKQRDGEEITPETTGQERDRESE